MTTVCTQPSISASSVSSRSSAAVCSGVAFGSKMPWFSSCSICDGSVSDAGLKPARELLDAAHVDLHALGERLDGVEQLAGQPRHVAEQSVVGGLARREEGQDLAARLLEALGQRLDGLGHQRGHPLGAQRQPNIGGGQHFSRQLAQRLTEL